MSSIKPLKLPLLEGEITFEEAAQEEENMLIRLGYPRERDEFFSYLLQHQRDIESIIAHHLNLRRDQKCDIAPPSDWVQGCFNVCIPVRIANWHAPRMMMRCPLPYKLGERQYPGNVEEKLRCEAATFAWIHENCPDVPIPYLWGMGLPSGPSFTPVEKLPIRRWIWAKIHRMIGHLFRRTSFSHLAHHPCSVSLLSGYLLMDYIEETQGKMLAVTWNKSRVNEELRKNLFRSLSRIMLSLGRVPLPRIGSFTMDNDGSLTLTNRPLTLRCPYLENEGIPRVISRDLCYSSVHDYLNDLLSYHDLRLKYHPNAVRNEHDAAAQMAVLTVIRSLLPQFTRRDLRHGPFVFRLTDLHTGNIFVDEMCNITSLVDLEWGASLPIETDGPPFWLSGRSLDELDEHQEEFNAVRGEFMEIFEEEERRIYGHTTRSGIMREAWTMGTIWCMAMLNDPKAMYNVFFEHIMPLYNPSFTDDDEIKLQETLSKFWTVGWNKFIEAKIAHKETYLRELQQLFKNPD